MTTSSTRSESGYTLLEICISLGILAVLFFAVVPSIDGFLQERRLRGVADQILEFAAKARGEARSQGVLLVATIDGPRLLLPDGRSHMLDKDIRVAIRGADGKWASPEQFRWRFSSVGMTEPLSFRLELGSRWLEMDIDPLTAMLSEERFFF